MHDAEEEHGHGLPDAGRRAAGPLEMDGIEEVVMKMGDRPAMKMSGMMLGMMRTQLS